jgi:hypothetical protein
MSIKIRYIIAEVTMQIALPLPCGEPAYDEFLTNEGAEHYANDEADIVDEFIPALKGQMERDIENLNRYHFKLKVLRDATEEDRKEFSIKEI